MFKKLFLMLSLVCASIAPVYAAADGVTQADFERAKLIMRERLQAQGLDGICWAECSDAFDDDDHDDSSCATCKFYGVCTALNEIRRTETATALRPKDITLVTSVLNGSCAVIQKHAKTEKFEGSYKIVRGIIYAMECPHNVASNTCTEATCFDANVAKRANVLAKAVRSPYIPTVYTVEEQALLQALADGSDRFVQVPPRVTQLGAIFAAVHADQSQFDEYGIFQGTNEQQKTNHWKLEEALRYECEQWEKSLGRQIEHPHPKPTLYDRWVVNKIIAAGNLDAATSYDDYDREALQKKEKELAQKEKMQKWAEKIEAGFYEYSYLNPDTELSREEAELARTLNEGAPCRADINDLQNTRCGNAQECVGCACKERAEIIEKAAGWKFNELSPEQERILEQMRAGTDPMIDRAREIRNFERVLYFPRPMMFEADHAMCAHGKDYTACTEPKCFRKEVAQRIAALEKKMQMFCGATIQLSEDEKALVKEVEDRQKQYEALLMQSEVAGQSGDDTRARGFYYAAEKLRTEYLKKELGYTAADMSELERNWIAQQNTSGTEGRVSFPAPSPELQAEIARTVQNPEVAIAAARKSLQGQSPQSQSSDTSSQQSVQTSSGTKPGNSSTPSKPNSGKPADAASGKPAGKPDPASNGNPVTQKSDDTSLGRWALRAGYGGGLILAGTLLYKDYARAHKTIRMRNAQLSDNECAAQARAQLWTRLKKNKGLLALGVLSVAGAAADIYCAATAA